MTRQGVFRPLYAVVSTAEGALEGADWANAARSLLPHVRIGRRVQRRVKAPCKTSSMPIVFAGAAESPFPRWTGYRQEAIDRGRGRVSPILYLYIDALPFAVARRLLPPMSRGRSRGRKATGIKAQGPVRSSCRPGLPRRRPGRRRRRAERHRGAPPDRRRRRARRGGRVPAGSYRMPPSALDGARVQVGRRRFLRLAASPRP